jgi:hypothetical protein
MAAAAFFGTKDLTKKLLLELGLQREAATVLAVGAACIPCCG